MSVFPKKVTTTSVLAAESRCHLVSLALSLSFFISGQGYASYRKTLGKGLGLGVVSEEGLCEDAKLQEEEHLK